MTNDQRILRLEALLVAIYDALPNFIRSALPNLVHDTMKRMHMEFEIAEKGVQIHE